MPNCAMSGLGEQLSQGEMTLALDPIKTFWGEDEQASQELVTKQTIGGGEN